MTIDSAHFAVQHLPRHWIAIIPVKSPARAKTRLAPGIAQISESQIAVALAKDTVAAIRACTVIEQIVVVTDDAVLGDALQDLGATWIAETAAPIASPGFERLNAAFEQGARHAATLNPDLGVVALTADLATLRPAELLAALAEAQQYPRSFAADASGTGTSALIASPGTALDPRFGADSAAAHESSGAARLTGAYPSLRQDIDTVHDLRAAARLGFGAHLRALVPADF